MFNEFHFQTRGRAHEQAGTEGQDRTAYLSRHGVQVMCLADGAGSAKHSAVGAQAVVDQGCAMLTARFAQLVTSTDADQSRGEILEILLARLDYFAQHLGCRRADLASTFLAVATSADRFVAIHIGDGVIGYIRDGKLRVVSAPDNAEFANQTVFVTSAEVASSVRLFRGNLEGVAGFIQMSDGASASLYDNRTGTLAPACAKLIEAVRVAPVRQAKNPEHKKRLRRIVETRLRQATKDDCAIGILGRRP